MRLGLFERRVGGRERALCADVDILLYRVEIRHIILRLHLSRWPEFDREDLGYMLTRLKGVTVKTYLSLQRASKYVVW